MGAIDTKYSSEKPTTLFIGFDCEYSLVNGQNRVLSYQFFACAHSGSSWNGIRHPNGHRFSLSKFLSGAVLKGLQMGKLSIWPKKIVLIGHCNLADIVLFSDFNRRKYMIDAIRRTFISLIPMPCRLYDSSNHLKKLTVDLRDSMLLAPDGKESLKDLGELIGCEKIELAQGQIERMDDLLLTDPKRFDEYALRSPEICVRYALKIAALNESLTGRFEVPPTLPCIVVSHLLELWNKQNACKHAVLGTEEIVEVSFNQTSQRSFRKKLTVPTEERFHHETFVSQCYHGARNEQYFFGAGELGIWTDWDLTGAYSTALALIGLPDWQSIRPSNDLNDFQPNVLGFAQVRFRFPDSTRFPCLPVRTAHGLVFPLSGVSYCCAPEIYLAQRLGCHVELFNAIILPTDFSIRPFEGFVIDCTRRRKSHPKGSLDNLFWKEIANSLYGKLAQGLMHKRCFDSRTGNHHDLHPSKITNPFFAAFTTSFIRAALGEILARLPLTASVSNATTDGFLTDASDDDVLTATEGPLCRLYAQTRIRLCGVPTVLEAKHRIAQPLGWRTRGQATLEGIEGEAMVLAKAGAKLPVRERAAQNEWIIEEFLNRTPESKQTFSTLRGLTDIYKHGGDLIKVELSRRTSMEYDWKRQPIAMQTRPIQGTAHLFFDTVPWQSVEEFNTCRERWELYRTDNPVVLKTESDLAAFEEYRALAPAPGIKRSRRPGATLTQAKRQFLRALVRSEWGLCAEAFSYSEIARWLSDGGFPTKKSDLENSKRPNSRLVECCVPRTAEVERFTAFIRGKFPKFDESRLLKLQSDVRRNDGCESGSQER